MSFRVGQCQHYLFELFDFISNYLSFLEGSINLLHKHVGYYNRKIVSVVVLFRVFANETQLLDHFPLVRIDIVEYLECFSDLMVFWLEKFDEVIDSCHRIMSKKLLFTILYKFSQTFFSFYLISLSLEPLKEDSICLKFCDLFALFTCIFQAIKVI